jgi:hypothetical protein
MSRIALAIVTLLISAAGAVVWQMEGGDTTGPVLVRVGIVLAAIWLAMPQLKGSFKRIGGQYLFLIAITGVAAMVSRGGIKGIIPLVVFAALALGGLHLLQRFLGSSASRPEEDSSKRRKDKS